MEEITFEICLHTDDLRIAHYIAKQLQKNVAKQVAKFGGEEQSEDTVKIVCLIWRYECLPLWKVFERAQLEAQKFGVAIKETYLSGTLNENLFARETQHFLKCRKIEKT
ncbi:MAG: hypothetical protein H0Z35_11375 [Thermoanaerobacteraceae bacterium]|nr:hypothetical protein [Thermoanaerobacteraceae bacterium]